MNGPKHYERAEAILGEIGHALEYGLSDTVTSYQLAAAQVHATLALAAATAMAAYEILPELDVEAWDRVAGVQEDDDSRSDAEIVADLNAVFGEPVEGRDYDVMPGAHLVDADENDTDHDASWSGVDIERGSHPEFDERDDDEDGAL